MQQIKEEIFPIDVIDVALIRIRPPCRPCIDDGEGIATILKLWPSADNRRMIHNECMLAPKIGTEFIIWNAASTLICCMLVALLGLFLFRRFAIVLLFHFLVLFGFVLVVLFFLLLRLGLILTRRLHIILGGPRRFRSGFFLRRLGFFTLFLGIDRTGRAQQH